MTLYYALAATAILLAIVIGFSYLILTEKKAK
jgi:hypothetical protein